MLLSIVLPTIAGREDELAQSMEAYKRTTPAPIEWIIERDHPTCAAAWNSGASKATCEFLHMGADDIQPEPGWWDAARPVLDAGDIPLGWIREPNGAQFGRDFPRVVICRREWWVDVPPELHYWSDNWFGDAMTATGHKQVVAEGFDFFHRRSMVGRGAGMSEHDRMEHDFKLYSQLPGVRELQGPC